MAQTIKLKRSATSGATPTTSQLELGEVAINTYDGKMYIKKNVGGTESIVEIGSGGGGGSALASSFTLYEYTATANQTTFSGSDSNSNTLAYDTGTPPKILVYLNGVLLDYTTDYTATTGTSVVLTAAAAASDILQVAAYKSSASTNLNISLVDNVKLKFGNDDDLQVFHNGTDSVINQTGTGDLLVQKDETTVAEFNVDGVTVTGDVEADEFIGDVRGAVLFKAQAGETLAKGDVVYISGISGNTTVVSKADADDANKMPAFGIAAAAASSGNPVDIYTNGILSGIDTSSYSEGDELFVSTTAGVLTATPPTGESAALQKIGKVTRSASSGSIFIIGAGRSNAVPNLDDGDIFIGNASNQAVSASLNTKIESYLDGGTSTPTFAGLATTANMTFGDNDKAIFGASSDLQIYHDGSNSYINDTAGTGNLYIASNQLIINNAANSENMARFAENGAATLYYDGSAKIATTSSGIDVTGTLTADGLTVDVTDQVIINHSGDGGGIRIDSTNGTNTGSLRFGDDLDNYIGAVEYNHSTNTLSLYADNATRVSVDSTGIDVTGSVTADGLTVESSSDPTTITLRQTGNTSGFILKNYNGNEAQLVNADNGVMVFKTNDLEAMRITGAGNVGIGTSSPSGSGWDESSTVLHVYENTTNGGLLALESSNTKAILNAGNDQLAIFTTTADPIRIGTSGTERMRITSAGDVEIKSGGELVTYRGDNARTGKLYTDNNAMTLLASHDPIKYWADDTGYHAFGFGSDTTTNEKMRLTYQGNVGIGTTSPGSYNSVMNDLVVAGSTDSGITIASGTSSEGSLAFADGTSGADAYRGWINYNHNSNFMRFFTNATERLRIDSSGNVGVKQTSPGSYYAKDLVVGGGSAEEGITIRGSSSGRSYLMFADGTSGNEQYRGYLSYNHADDALEFATGASERMRITSAGRLGLGTTSPARKLEISSGHVRLSDDYKVEWGGGTNYVQGSNANNRLVFATNGSERMRIDSSSAVVQASNAGGTTSFEISNTNGVSTLYNKAALYLSATGAEANAARIESQFTGTVSTNHAQELKFYTVNTGSSPVERMKISAGGDVQVGTAAVTGGRYFDIYNTGSTATDFAITRFITQQVGSSSTTSADVYKRKNGEFGFANNDTNSAAYINFKVGTSERMRIDSSGNLLVGGTSAYQLDAATITAGGQLYASRTSANALEVNRSGTDGEIIRLQKAGSTVGSIGAAAGDLTIGTGDTGLTFEDAADVIHPINVSTGAARDNTIDLGKSAARFKNLHLAGRSYSVGITSYTSALRLESLDTSVNAEQSIGDIEFVSNDSSTGGSGVQAKISAVSDNAFGTAYALTFQTGSQASPSEKVRIDHLGNLLAGKTASAFGTAGVEINQNGVAGKVFMTRSGGDPLSLNRLSSDGQIQGFYKDGTQVGSADAYSGYLKLYGGSGSAGSGLWLANGAIYPVSTTNTVADAVTDIGHSSYRFKNLYLSGGVQNVTASGVAKSTLISAISGVTNGFQIHANSSNQMTYDFNTGLGLKMQLTNGGDLFVGTSAAPTGSTGGSGFITESVGRKTLKIACTTTSGAGLAEFINPNGVVGTIVTNGSSTAYNTSSDQRLKENIVDAPSASDDIDAIQVRSFDWKADGSHQKYGMVAQELNTVAPDAVTIPDDPEEMAGVDYSKLVPMLVKEIQSLRARVAQLEQ